MKKQRQEHGRPDGVGGTACRGERGAAPSGFFFPRPEASCWRNVCRLVHGRIVLPTAVVRVYLVGPALLRYAGAAPSIPGAGRSTVTRRTCVYREYSLSRERALSLLVVCRELWRVRYVSWCWNRDMLLGTSYTHAECTPW